MSDKSKCPRMNMCSGDIKGVLKENEEKEPHKQTKPKWTHEDPAIIHNYDDYLKLNQVLTAERLTEDEESHDEHLFIIVHQSFELWFKQILYDIDSITPLLKLGRKLCERKQLRILHRFNRLNVILRIMTQQFEVLETMGCVNFAAFRDMYTASGFQSIQFKLLEIKLGIKLENRGCTFLTRYNAKLTDEQRHILEDAAKVSSLFDLIQQWLERTPALESFIASYKAVIDKDYVKMMKNADSQKDCDPRKDELLNEAFSFKKRYYTVIDYEEFESTKKERNVGLSYKAFWGAIMITSYCHEPRFAVPSELLKSLIDMDALLTKWRFAHAMMTKKMIGSKMGTGGSSGYFYLRSTVSDRYMPFKDLFEIAAFILPPQKMPELTPEMRAEISNIYIYETQFQDKKTSYSSSSTGFADEL